MRKIFEQLHRPKPIKTGKIYQNIEEKQIQ